MQKTLLQTALICLFAFLGGIASDQFLRPTNSYAQMMQPELRRDSLNTTQVYNDPYGHKRIDIDAASGYGVQDFYGSNGTLRLQLGTYSGAERAGSEAGLPLVGLSDVQGRLRLLLRLAQGSNQSPVMVMKDTKGKDRIIMGTSLNGEDEEPFLAYVDKDGNKHKVFGNF